MKKFFTCLLLCTFAFQNANANGTFEENLMQWLSTLGFQGKINTVEKKYDEDGFLDMFFIDLEEQAAEGRTNPNIVGAVVTNQKNQEVHVKIYNKDIKGIPYMYFDWVAKLVINYAVKKISRILGFQTDVEGVANGLTLVKINPAKSTVESRYRFKEIRILYSVEDLILNVEATLTGADDYLITELLKGELNALLRSLERSPEPVETIFAKSSLRLTGSSISDRLLKEVLREPPKAVLEEALRNRGFSP